MISAGIPRIRLKPIRMRLYNSLIISYTLIFVLATYAFAFAATKYYTKFETIKNLQQSRSALNAICNYYALKQAELPNTLLPLFQTDVDHFCLETMLKSTDDEIYSDPIAKMEMFDVLQKIADNDEDIKEILLYKDINGSKYVYLRENQTIEKVGVRYTFFDAMVNQKSGRIIAGTQKTGTGAVVNSDAVYGIGGVIGVDKGAGIEGRFLIAYNTEALERVLQGYIGTYGRFIMASNDGDVIYDSDGKYDGKKFPHMDVLLSGKDSASIDGQQCYIQTIEVQKASVIGFNIVPKNTVGDNKFTLLVYGTFILLALISGVLYKVGGFFISRRVKEIGFAMENVGSNNLTYRIPVLDRGDEFEEIAIKFNEMCDEMQKIIYSEYISEIKKKNAELESLQTGINPHFLYNTLEVIRVRAIDHGCPDVGKMIVDLAHLYRAIVKNCTIIPIRNEINICDIYIDIFSYGYENSLEYETNIDPQVMKLGIPKNLLQPIIENYFVHGIKDESYDNRFAIHGFLEKGDICFILEDNGRGMAKEKLDEIKSNMEEVQSEAESGYGLLSVQKRIWLIYGKPYGIKLESKENNMTRITVLIKAMTCNELEASLKSL